MGGCPSGHFFCIILCSCKLQISLSILAGYVLVSNEWSFGTIPFFYWRFIGREIGPTVLKWEFTSTNRTVNKYKKKVKQMQNCGFVKNTWQTWRTPQGRSHSLGPEKPHIPCVLVDFRPHSEKYVRQTSCREQIKERRSEMILFCALACVILRRSKISPH